MDSTTFVDIVSRPDIAPQNRPNGPLRAGARTAVGVSEQIRIYANEGPPSTASWRSRRRIGGGIGL
jgi:hypothetical protein